MSSAEVTGAPKRLVICADDYAISPGVSRAIRELARARRISATSAMSCMSHWPEEALKLRQVTDAIEIGLHFTLTDQTPLGKMPILAPRGKMPGIRDLVLRSISATIPRGEVADELARQLDAFEAHFGRPPDFIDGHQHVHILPFIRRAVLDACSTRLDPKRCWVRDSAGTLNDLMAQGSTEAFIVAGLAFGFGETAHHRGILVNPGFSGFYKHGQESLGQSLPRLLAGAVNGSLLMLHPGYVDDALKSVDSLTAPRQGEYEFLMGSKFPLILAARGLSIAAPPLYR